MAPPGCTRARYLSDAWLPHGGLWTFHQESTCLHANDVRALCGHVTPHDMGSTKPSKSTVWCVDGMRASATHTHTDTHTHSLTLTHSHSHTLTHTLSHSQIHSLTHSHTHTYVWRQAGGSRRCMVPPGCTRPRCLSDACERERE